MSIKLIPTNDRLLVKEIEFESKIEGIYLPDSMREDCKMGLVIGIGDSKQMKEGDKILFGFYAGIDVHILGEEVKLLKEIEVIAMLREVPDGE